MEIDRRRDRAVYKQVADALRDEIRSGQLSAGEPLPSETQLTARYRVSRNSVRSALGLLRVEGLVVTEQGRGSFVREGRALRRLGSSADFEMEDAELDQRLVGVEVVRPPEEVADRLGLLGDALFEHGGDIWGEDVGVAGSCWKAPAIGGGLG